jgi:hypothetical protein
MHALKNLGLMLLVGAMGFWASGCGGVSDMPELADVSGTVTMDGKPVVGIIILFKPDKGRPAMGTTDAEGKYTLEYLHDEVGTKVGPSTVSFEWPIGASGPPIPAKYGSNSQEKVEVIPGKRNVFDFDLMPPSGAKAKVIRPSE